MEQNEFLVIIVIDIYINSGVTMSKKIPCVIAALIMGINCSQAIELGSKQDPFLNLQIIKSRNLNSNLHATCLTSEQIERLELKNLKLNGLSCLYNNRQVSRLGIGNLTNLSGITGAPKNFALGTYSDINRFTLKDMEETIGSETELRKSLQHNKAVWADLSVDNYYQEFELSYGDPFENSYYTDDSHLSISKKSDHSFFPDYKSISEVEALLDTAQFSAEDVKFLNAEYSVSYDIATYLGNFTHWLEVPYSFNEYTLMLREQVKYDMIQGRKTCLVDITNRERPDYESSLFMLASEEDYPVSDINEILTKDLNYILKNTYSTHLTQEQIKVKKQINPDAPNQQYPYNSYYNFDNLGLYALTVKDGQDVDGCDYGVAFISYKDLDKYLTPKFKKNLPTYQKKVKMRF